MAIIKTGALVVGIRGTIDGVTFSQNPNGPYAKGWRRPVNKSTTAQQPRRAAFGNIGRLWNGISSALQEDWDDYAALPAQTLYNSFGDPYNMTGFGWFRSINLNRLTAGQAVSTAVPTIAQPSPPNITNMVIRETNAPLARWFFDNDPGSGYYALTFMAVSNRQGGVTPPVRPQPIGVTPLTGSTTTVFFTSNIENAFGPISQNRRYFLHAYFQTSEGRRSAVAVDWTDGLP